MKTSISDIIRRVAFSDSRMVKTIAEEFLERITKASTQGKVDPKEVIETLYRMKNKIVFGTEE